MKALNNQPAQRSNFEAKPDILSGILRITVFAMAICLLATTYSQAQSTVYTLTIPGATSQANVAIDGNRAVVGVNNTGKVYEFDGTNWVLTATLVPSGATGSIWEIEVDISGNQIILASPQNNTGHAYIFEYNGSSWTETAQLAPPALYGGGYGFSVAIDNNKAVVGARWDGEENGGAYIYGFNGSSWVQTAHFTGIPDEYGLYGHGVDIQGNRVAVAAYWEDAAYIYEYIGGTWSQTEHITTGVQYVALANNRIFMGKEFGTPTYEYDGTNWNFDTTIKPTGIKEGDYYDTWRISASGDRVVFAGAKTYNDVPNVVYVTEKVGGSWTKIAELAHPGATFQISGDNVIVGLTSGSVKIYNFSTAIAETKISASDKAANDNFGNSVGIFGSSAIVGSMSDDSPATDAGSAYIFAKGATWTQYSKLTATDAAAGDNFGSGVDMSNAYAVVGAPMNDDNGVNSGSAYIFTPSSRGWAQMAKLLPNDGAAEDHFGYAVAISNDIAVVGAPDDDQSSKNNAGSAYVFKYNGTKWVQNYKIVPTDLKSGDQFGASVAIDGGRIVVGAYKSNDKGGDSGSAYVYEYNGSTWVAKAKLLASDGAGGDRFGVSVSINGSNIVVGANENDDAGSGSGSAYVFKYSGSTWSQVAKLTASDAAAGDRFGSAVSISGKNIVVGSSYEDHSGKSNSGAAYIFAFSGGSWSETEKLIASDGGAGDGLGNAVDIDGANVIAGAYRDDNPANNNGSAYIFDLSVVSSSSRLAMDALPDKSLSASILEETETTALPASRNMVKVAYPNPIQQELTVKLDNPVSGDVMVRLVDDAGTTLYSEVQTVDSFQEEIKVNLTQANIHPGVLFLRLDSKESTGVPFRLLKSK